MSQALSSFSKVSAWTQMWWILHWMGLTQNALHVSTDTLDTLTSISHFLARSHDMDVPFYWNVVPTQVPIAFCLGILLFRNLHPILQPSYLFNDYPLTELTLKTLFKLVCQCIPMPLFTHTVQTAQYVRLFNIAFSNLYYKLICWPAPMNYYIEKKSNLIYKIGPYN